ncbi:MAG TPA: Na/Pi cotransporter family protein [Halanaerobiales bacterium]|nr:Na/Pi cotransporter family protein [Halanaerobiales bacterium]
MSPDMIFSLLGGLGLFIYGMKRMSDGLQKVAGKRLKHLIGLLTTNRFAGIGVGALVTAIIQSSSATTVMVVGFVNAGLMSLVQSIGVTMGANIGTTVTAQLIAFKLSNYALHAIAIGAGFYLFSKRDRTKQIGQIILGFGVLFLGLTIMKDTMRPLRDSAYFIDVMETFGQSPILGVLLGTAMTVMLQSSSASIGILISLLSVGVIDYWAAVPILLGDNIGTTITAMLSSIGANKTAKRAAAAHFMFNVVGTSFVVALFYIIPNFADVIHSIVVNVTGLFGKIPSQERLIANTHTLFNVLNTLVWIPFVGLMANIVTRVIPGEDSTIKRGLYYLDERMIETPGVIMEQVNNEVIRMHEITKDMVDEATEGFINKDEELANSVIEKEEIVNEIEEELMEFLTKISHSSLSEEDIQRLDAYFSIIDAIESIADDAYDIADLTKHKIENNVSFSEEAKDTMSGVMNRIRGLMLKSIEIVETENLDLLKEILDGEEELDNLQIKYRDGHMKRLNEGTCSPNAGIVYLEALEDVEHISDQFADIGLTIKEMKKKHRN